MHGWQWIVDGVRLVSRKPITFATFFLMIFFAFLIGSQNQLLMIAVQLFLPALLGGGYRICEAVDHGQSVPASMLTSGFRNRVGEFTALGGVYFFSNVVALLATLMFGGQEFMQAMADPTAMTPEMREALEPRMRMAMIVALAIILPLQLALWFAPTALALGDTSVARALRLSLIAVVKNIVPFLVYGGAIFLVSYVGIAALNLLGLGGMRAIFLIVSLLVPAMVPTIYASYKDLFAADQPQDLPNLD